MVDMTTSMARDRLRRASRYACAPGGTTLSPLPSIQVVVEKYSLRSEIKPEQDQKGNNGKAGPCDRQGGVGNLPRSRGRSEKEQGNQLSHRMFPLFNRGLLKRTINAAAGR